MTHPATLWQALLPGTLGLCVVFVIGAMLRVSGLWR